MVYQIRTRIKSSLYSKAPKLSELLFLLNTKMANKSGKKEKIPEKNENNNEMNV